MQWMPILLVNVTIYIYLNRRTNHLENQFAVKSIIILQERERFR